jgi:16S rRNA processing protein RimM
MVQFAGIDDRDAAESMRGVALSIPADERRPLEDGEYWPEELEGCVALDPTGRSFGTVTGIVEGAAQDRIVVVTAGGANVEVPFVAAIVVEVDPAARRLVIDPPEGLFAE